MLDDSDTLFRCTLERNVNGARETRVVEIWAGWPGMARREAEALEGGWRVVGVSADFGRRRRPRSE